MRKKADRPRRIGATLPPSSIGSGASRTEHARKRRAADDVTAGEANHLVLDVGGFETSLFGRDHVIGEIVVLLADDVRDSKTVKPCVVREIALRGHQSAPEHKTIEMHLAVRHP